MIKCWINHPTFSLKQQPFCYLSWLLSQEFGKVWLSSSSSKCLIRLQSNGGWSWNSWCPGQLDISLKEFCSQGLSMHSPLKTRWLQDRWTAHMVAAGFATKHHIPTNKEEATWPFMIWFQKSPRIISAVLCRRGQLQNSTQLQREEMSPPLLDGNVKIKLK